MDDAANAKKVVAKMMGSDWFSQWLGISIEAIGIGHCTLKLKVRKDMLNGFQIAHGGITYSLADSALAFASNSHGRQAVSIETSISHTVSLHEGDVIIAQAEEISLKEKIAIYYIKIFTETNVNVALFRGTVYRTLKNWDV